MWVVLCVYKQVGHVACVLMCCVCSNLTRILESKNEKSYQVVHAVLQTRQTYSLRTSALSNALTHTHTHAFTLTLRAHAYALKLTPSSLHPHAYTFKLTRSRLLTHAYAMLTHTQNALSHERQCVRERQ